MLDTDLLAASAVDVHQHLWPEAFVDRLRARRAFPYLRGWRLHTAGEPPYDVDPADHDPAARVRLDLDAGVVGACLALSSPLGIEQLPAAESVELLDAWHAGLDDLPAHFDGWAAPGADADAGVVGALLARDRVVGLQLPATLLGTPAGWEQVSPLLSELALADRPLLVHPGPVAPSDASVPSWWAPVVDYTAQMTASWWSWLAWHGRDRHPTLRVVFAAGAGLAPVHHERHRQRGGEPSAVDPLVFVDSSGYGPRALDALVRVLGIDALVLGSDRPYGTPVAELFGEAATHAVHVTNPMRLLGARHADRLSHRRAPAWS